MLTWKSILLNRNMKKEKCACVNIGWYSIFYVIICLLDLQHLNIYNYTLRAFIYTFNLGPRYVMGALISDKNVPLVEFGQNIFLKSSSESLDTYMEKIYILISYLTSYTRSNSRYVLDLHVSDKSLKLMLFIRDNFWMNIRNTSGHA